jgi:hypothetical protein
MKRLCVLQWVLAQPKNKQVTTIYKSHRKRHIRRWVAVEEAVAMPDLALPEAEALLRAHGGYDWLLSGKQFWSVSEIVEEFDRVGLKVSHDAVTRWIKPLPFTDDFGDKIGLRAARNDLIVYFARRLRGSGGLTDELSS